MDLPLIIGIVAGLFTTFAIIPQIVRTWKTKEVKDVSIGMFLILITGVSLWFVYGILKSDIPIMVTNGISVLLNLVMLYFIIIYSKKKNDSSNKLSN